MSNQEHIPTLTDASFESKVLSAKRPTIVMCTAPWNKPGTLSKNNFETLSKEFADRVQTFTLNVNDHPTVISHYEVSSLPAWLLMHQGDVHDTVQGLVPQPRQRKLFELAAELNAEENEHEHDILR